MRRLFIVAAIAVVSTVPACRREPAAVLLFTGRGTSPGDVAAVEAVLRREGLSYSTANSSQMNAMDVAGLRGYRLLIVPGGNFIEIGTGLTAGATAAIREAVKGGVNYLGICAGAFFAGHSGFNDVNLTSGVKFGFYAASARGIRKVAVAISTPGAPTLEHYWEDGPELSGWGTAVGRYPNGTPAIVQGTFGAGWVTLTGVHAEAPESWRQGMTFATPADVDNAYAGTLVRAVLDRVALPHD